MTGLGDSQQPMTLHDYVSVVRRRIWTVVITVVLLVAAAIGYSLHETPVYQASANLLVGATAVSPASGSAGTPSYSGPSPADLATDATLARSPNVLNATIQKSGVTGRTAGQLLAESSVAPSTTANLLTFTVRDSDPKIAAVLAITYARQFEAFQRKLETQSFQMDIKDLKHRIAQLGAGQLALRNSLLRQEQQVRTQELLQTQHSYLISSFPRGVKVSPKPVRNAILGFLVGIILGLALAFSREALDTRVRRADEVTLRLPGLPLPFPLLGRVPAPPKRLAESGHLAMLDEPAGPHAEAYRMLRTNLDLACLERDVRTIMITSAVEQEGKSTTIANLAVALARAGKHVTLVDLDLRRPAIARLFGLEGPGLTQVALGEVPLEDAIASVALTSTATKPATTDASGNGHKPPVLEGVLEVLPSGPIPPDPGEFVGTHVLDEILAALRERADLVLIDTPPVLQVGDAAALSSKVDAIVIATRLNVLRRTMLQGLGRQLASMPSQVLGVVVTGADKEQGYGYGYGYGYGHGYGRGGRFGYGARPANDVTVTRHERTQRAPAGLES